MATAKDILIAKINEAFIGVKLDGGIGLSEANAIDDYRDLKYRDECKKKDEAYFWNKIPVSLLNQFNSSLSFFDAKGMRFHLPAFLIAELNRDYEFNLVFILINLSDYSKSNFILLSKNQKEVVKLVLEYFLNDPNYEYERLKIENAIKYYWSNY